MRAHSISKPPTGQDLSSTSAMVIDGNPVTRSILVSQLRDLGFGQVHQCSRAREARGRLEYTRYDVVLCEQTFDKDQETGQDLVDDLRRKQLLPFSTVFIMVTAEATYAKVAEAAESALDGYLLKPHTASTLSDRIMKARHRKDAMQEVFSAIEREDFELAAQLCLQKYEAREAYWLYSARIGAELLLRLKRFGEAQAIYEQIVEARALPWAKLGIARSQLDRGDPSKAVATLESLITTDPTFTDAYDVMGKAQFEQGKLDKALEAFKLAATMTPHSITRLQTLGVMTYYSGDTEAAKGILSRVIRAGLNSKLFDTQTLVLKAFISFRNGDRKRLDQCIEDLKKLHEKRDDEARTLRQIEILKALLFAHDQQLSAMLEVLKRYATQIMEPDFDFEAASNFVGVLSVLASKEFQLDEFDEAVLKVGLRFCNTRSTSEILAGSAILHQPYVDTLRNTQSTILRRAEKALLLSMKGSPTEAIQELLSHGSSSLSSKLIETAHLLLQRYADKITQVDALRNRVQELRQAYCTPSASASAGNDKARQPGSLALRA